MVHAKKSLGQNFLMHAKIAERIARVADIPAGAAVFEIGPGTGTLTRELLKISHRVIALEADRELFDLLSEEFAEEIKEKKLELIYGDIRTFAIESLPAGYVLVANIPYYLTGEIFRMFLESRNQPQAMTLLVQKEVADRIIGIQKKSLGVSRSKESILSLSVKVYGTPKREFVVPRGAFLPAPKVDSAVLSVRNISRRNFANKEEEDAFFNILHAGFAHKRKFLRNNLLEAGYQVERISEKVRAEDIALSLWLQISRDVSSQRSQES